MELKFDITLKDLSLIAAADSLWNKECIVKKTKTYFCSPTRYEKLEVWDLITKEVVAQIPPSSLPEILYTEVVYLADILGKKMRDWFRYCRMRNIFRVIPKDKLYENYFKKMYWTYYGNIDEEKIIKSWFNNPNCDLWKVYIMACNFCTEETIKEIWVEVQKNYKPGEFDYLYYSNGSHMAAYWNRRFTNNLDNFVADIRLNFWNPDLYDVTKTAEENMLKLACLKGYKQAAKTFWFELTDEKRAENIDCFHMAVIYNCEGTKYVARYYRQEQFTEIAILLFNQMKDCAQIKTIQENTDLSEIINLLGNWPYVKFVVPFLNRTKGVLSENNYKELIETITCRGEEKFSLVNQDNVFRRILLKVWDQIPINLKEKMGECIIRPLFCYWDTVGLKRILNDKHLFKIKEELIAKGNHMFETFMKEKDQQKLQEFIDVLIPLRWDKDIRTKMGTVYDHVMKNEFDLADKLLDSFCRSEEERIGFKSAINHNIVCLYFIKKNELDIADKFLYWKSNSAEFVKNYKLSFSVKEYDFSLFAADHILSFWKTEKENTEVAKSRSTKFLQWLLCSEHLIPDFIKKIFKYDFIYISFFLNTDFFEIIDDFMSWCLLDELHKKSIIEECLTESKLIGKMYEYMVKNERDLAQRLLDFAFNSQSKQQKFWRIFLKSNDAIRACKLFIRHTCSTNMFEPSQSQEKICEKMKEFIKFWMKPLKSHNFKRVKKILEKWLENSFKKLEEKERSIKENCDSTDTSDGESDYECLIKGDEGMCCNKDDVNLFLNLLKSFEESDSEFSD